MMILYKPENRIANKRLNKYDVKETIRNETQLENMVMESRYYLFNSL